MAWALICIVSAGLTATAPVKSGRPGDRPTELEGTWIVTAITTLGVEYTPEQLKKLNMAIVIRGDQFSVRSARPSKGRIQLDPGANPKRIDFVAREGDEPAGRDRMTGHWIYELVGDKVRMAYFQDGEGRPQSIDAKDKSQVVVTATRAKE